VPVEVGGVVDVQQNARIVDLHRLVVVGVLADYGSCALVAVEGAQRRPEGAAE